MRRAFVLLVALQLPGCLCIAEFPEGLLADRQGKDAAVPDGPRKDAPLDGPSTVDPGRGELLDLRRDLSKIDLRPLDAAPVCPGTCATGCTNSAKCKCVGSICVVECTTSTAGAECKCPPGVSHCELQPSGGFSGNVVCNNVPYCTVKCSGSGNCSGEVQCKAATVCQVECTGSACTNKVKCETSKKCQVTCDGPSACDDPIECLNANNSCQVTCTNGACKSTVNCTGSCNCSVSCDQSSCQAGGITCLAGCGVDAGMGCRACPCGTKCLTCP